MAERAGSSAAARLRVMLNRFGPSLRICWCNAAACLAISSSACSGGGGTDVPERGIPKECTVLEPGEPAIFAADVHVLGTDYALGAAAGSLTRALLPDGGDVYWYDDEASLFVERQGDGQIIELRAGEPPDRNEHQVALGLAANAERLFVGYAYLPNVTFDSFSLDYDGPGLLVAISKQDGRSEVLIESAQRWLAPITADAERVIVFARGGEEGSYLAQRFYQVPLADPRLEPLPLARPLPPDLANPLEWQAPDVFMGGQLVGDEVYWASDAYSPPRLLSGRFHDVEPEMVMQVSDAYFVGPGYVLTQENVWLPGYHYAGRDFVVRDDSGCRALPGSRGRVVPNMALDAQFAYWVRRSPAPPGSFDPAPQLTRVDLASGAVTHLTTPGFTPRGYLEIAGHDATRVFLSDTETLISVSKP